ncbi:hypothetical protein IFM89_029858 [Coptis chinensis]|uniref:Uncharacterized protein n=1 Tax=Coptis chinensis TaxID=261450 RepID=A0A835LT90_9MAGN|nr:hypothetical protein IFM89_029858 [Coptis chinensis]
MEITSLKQKLKIEELEARLNEAEDVVTDLRAQLNAVQDKLEKMKKKTRLKPLDEQTSKSFAASHENSSQGNKLKTSEGPSRWEITSSHANEEDRESNPKTGLTTKEDITTEGNSMAEYRESLPKATEEEVKKNFGLPFSSLCHRWIKAISILFVNVIFVMDEGLSLDDSDDPADTAARKSRIFLKVQRD